MDPVADAVVRGETQDLGLEAPLGFDRYGLCPYQRSPHGKEPAIGAGVEDPPCARHDQSGAQIYVPAVHLARPGGIGRRNEITAPPCGWKRAPVRAQPRSAGTSDRLLPHAVRLAANDVSQRAVEMGRACRHTDSMSAIALGAMWVSLMGFAPHHCRGLPPGATPRSSPTTRGKSRSGARPRRQGSRALRCTCREKARQTWPGWRGRPTPSGCRGRADGYCRHGSPRSRSGRLPVLPRRSHSSCA